MALYVQKRLVIYVKDVEKITGRKPRTARRILQNIREKEGKTKNQLITIAEFCTYMHLREEDVFKFIGY